ASAAGDYYVIYLVVETDNYFAAPALSEIPTPEEIEALIATIIPVEIEAGTALVIVDSEGAIVAGEAVNTNNVYELKCGNTYKIYSNETLDTSTMQGLDISEAKNVEFEGQPYNYRYTVEFKDTIPDQTEIEFAHKHAATAFNFDNDHKDTDKVWVYCKGEPSTEAECIARLNTEGIYYYGTAPTDADVLVDKYFDAEAKIADPKEDFYFTLKGDTSASRLTANDLQVNKTYIVNAVVTVEIGNEISRLDIKREILFKAKPLTDCDVYLKQGEELIPLTITDGVITIPENTFTYNAQEQAPIIVIKNDVLGTETTLTSVDYTDGIAKKIDAGSYTSTLTAATGEEAKYSGSITVNWSIAKADVSEYITAAPVNNIDTDEDTEGLDAIVYDGQALDKTDFEVKAIEASEDDSDEVKAKKALAKKLIDEIAKSKTSVSVEGKTGFDLKTAGNQEGTVKLVNANYVDISKDVTPVIAKRAVTITPDANQKNIFGDTEAPVLTYTVEEQNDKSMTGFIESDLATDQTVNDFFGAAVKVGKEINTTNILNPAADDSYDYVEYDNDAGTYGYTIIAEALANYEPVLADGAYFTVEPKSFTSEDITVTLDNTAFAYNGTTRYVNVESVKDGIKVLVDGVDYLIGGTTQKILPGKFKVQAAGQGNYTDIAYAGWVINANDGDASISTINNGIKEYDGTDISGMFTVNTGSVPKANVTIEYYDANNNKLTEAPKDAGDYKVRAIISAVGYNDQNVEADITVEPVNVTVEGTLSADTIIYSDKEPEVTDVTFTGILEDEKEDFEANTTVEWTLDDENDQFIGEVKTTDEYANNYSFVVTPAGFQVEPKDIDSSDIRVFYTDKVKLAETGSWVTCNDISVVDVKKGKTLTEGIDYTLNGNTSKVTGDFTIEIVGIGHYYGVNEIKWTVVDTEEKAAASRIIDYTTFDDEGRISFTLHNTYKGSKEAKYGVLLYRGAEAIGDMTIEAAEENDAIVNQEYTFKTVAFRAKDIGNGVYVKPYIIVDGTVVYGEQIYVNYAELKEDEAIEASHCEIITVAKEDNEGRLGFTANYSYKGSKDVKYGVLVYRGTEEIGKMTIEAAAENEEIADQPFTFKTVAFRAKDIGNGLYVRTYMIIDGKVIYGAQKAYNYSDFT
ncbi:MAG: hypothetical protein J6Y64_05720, partial [Ruminococcus sp.]|nr:hypothetical protein [Ruminococcus sp.]